MEALGRCRTRWGGRWKSQNSKITPLSHVKKPLNSKVIKSFVPEKEVVSVFRVLRFNQTGDISTLDGTPLKLVDKFTYLGSSVTSTEKDIDMRLTKAWTAINRPSIIWKSDLTDKMKCSFFQAAVTSILLYGCTTWTLTKQLEKKQDGNYTRMLRAILNKSWQQHSTRHQLYGHLPPITKTIQVRRTRHAGHCWRSREELIRDVLLWTPTHGHAKAGRPARIYIQQLCEDTGCYPEDLPRAMNDREEWRERVRDIRATSTTWWWWWYSMWYMLYIWTISHIHIWICYRASPSDIREGILTLTRDTVYPKPPTNEAFYCYF